MNIRAAQLLRQPSRSGCLHQGGRPEDRSTVQRLVLSSHMAGHDAAAVQEPMTIATCPASSRHARLIEKNSAEMAFVRENLILQRQEGTARSTALDRGKRFCRAISCARRCFFTVSG